jgi:hypothetical protein
MSAFPVLARAQLPLALADLAVELVDQSQARFDRSLPRLRRAERRGVSGLAWGVRRVTVAKLRWLFGKATADLGEVRLANLSLEQVCAWRLTVPEGHRFEATQALRQPIDDNPG